MGARALILLGLLGPAPDFQAVVALVAEERFPEAVALAHELADPLQRAQAELYARHHGGDLAGALEAGLDGLANAPDDPWLLERTGTLAVELGAADLARALAERLVLAAPPGGRWEAATREVRAGAAALEASRARRERAATAARATVFGGAALGLVLAGCAARRRR